MPSLNDYINDVKGEYYVSTLACRRIPSMKPIELEEPMHPEAKKEYDQRTSLAQAMKDEISLLDDAIDTMTNDKVSTMTIFPYRIQRGSLQRLLNRWTEGATYELNSKEKKFKRTDK